MICRADSLKELNVSQITKATLHWALRWAYFQKRIYIVHGANLLQTDLALRAAAKVQI